MNGAGLFRRYGDLPTSRTSAQSLEAILAAQGATVPAVVPATGAGKLATLGQSFAKQAGVGTVYDWQPAGDAAGGWVAIGYASGAEDVYLSGGQPTGSFVDSVKAFAGRVPTWAWLALGGGVAVIGAAAFMRRGKR